MVNYLEGIQRIKMKNMLLASAFDCFFFYLYEIDAIQLPPGVELRVQRQKELNMWTQSTHK